MRTTPELNLATLLLFLLAPLPHGNGSRPTPPPAQPPPPAYGGPPDGTRSGGTTGGGTTNGPQQGGRTSQPPVPASGGTKTPSGPGTNGPAPGITLTEDFARWLYWWEFNRDLYLGRCADRAAPAAAGTTAAPGAGGRPSDAEVQQQVIPALLSALATSRQRDLVTSSLVALARASRDEDEVLPVLRRYLGERDQEVSEVSAIALGILGSAAALADLAAVVQDTPAGRALTCRPTGVSMRTRAFAGFGLGLIARSSADPVARLKVIETLSPLLRAVTGPERDLRVAAVSALGCLGVDPRASYAGGVLCERAARVLLDFYSDPLARRDLARAHVPTALARLVAGDRDLRPHCMDRLLADLVDNREDELVRQSCALALGALAQPDEDDAVSAALLEHYRRGRDARARNFALMAMGQIGGVRNKARLLALLGEVRKLDRPWVALALAVLGRNADDLGIPDVARGVGAAIAAELDPVRNKNPENRAGFCIALGILRHADGARAILGFLREEAKNDEASGLAALALGLVGHTSACGPLRTLLAESTGRPARLRNVAEALRLLGDVTAAEPMVGLLSSLDNKQALFTISSAIGRMGDRRCLPPLVGIVKSAKADDRTRSHAATALGLLGDRRDLPWNMQYALGVNFHACSETLANGAGGVLDIL